MVVHKLRSLAEAATAGYSPQQELPLATYAGMTGVFLAGFGGSLLVIRLAGKELPERIAAADLVLLGLATHKLSRVVAKDKVTSFLRAPFTRFAGPAGQGELAEEPRGEGVQLAVGELLACPYCLAQWVAASFVVALLAAPRLTRLIASIYAAQTMSDFMQLVYLLAKESAP
jgi:hypothetical protein